MEARWRGNIHTEPEWVVQHVSKEREEHKKGRKQEKSKGMSIFGDQYAVKSS